MRSRLAATLNNVSSDSVARSWKRRSRGYSSVEMVITGAFTIALRTQLPLASPIQCDSRRISKPMVPTNGKVSLTVEMAGGSYGKEGLCGMSLLAGPLCSPK